MCVNSRSPTFKHQLLVNVDASLLESGVSAVGGGNGGGGSGGVGGDGQLLRLCVYDGDSSVAGTAAADGHDPSMSADVDANPNAFTERDLPPLKKLIGQVGSITLAFVNHHFPCLSPNTHCYYSFFPLPCQVTLSLADVLAVPETPQRYTMHHGNDAAVDAR
jgi:hypothetical protein